MKKTIPCIFLVFSILFLIPDISICQNSGNRATRVDYDYSKFKSTFQKEFGEKKILELEVKESNSQKVFNKTDLPSWAKILPTPTNKVIYAIGVSDPGMQQDSALLLAIIRAKALCALLNNVTMNGLSDYFIEEKDLANGDILSSVYKEFNKMESNLLYNQDNFKILEKTFTNNGESIVLVSIDISQPNIVDTASINCLVELSSSHIVKNNKKTLTYRSDIFALNKLSKDNSRDNFYYVIKKKDKQLATKSFYYGSPISQNNSLMSYNSTNSDSNDELALTCSLEQGLWHAISSILLQTYTLNFNENNVIQSGMTDNHVKVSKDINRILSSKELSAHLLGLNIQSNILKLDISFKPID